MVSGFTHPESNIAHLHLHEGMNVADIGAGTGIYTVFAGKIVGASGRVYAVEVQKTLLSRIATSVRDAGLDNVYVLWGDVERLGGTKIPDHVVDAVIVSNILFQTEHKKDLVAEVRRILSPRGKGMIIDWEDSFGGIGPSEDMVIEKREAVRLFADAGFDIGESFDAGTHHYGFIVEKR